MSEPVLRVGGRLLLLDPADRVLLIHERLESGATHWLTPGGGVEAGEHPRAAAVREAMEETGIAVDVPDDAPAVLTTRRLWSWRETVYDQTDHFFLARVGSGVRPQPRHLTDVEQQTWLGFDWWDVERLRATTELLVPPDLGDVLAGLLTTPRQPHPDR